MARSLRRWVQYVARLGPVTVVMSKMLPPVDKVLRRISRGRVNSVAQLVAPSLVLYSTGAKSGQRRENPLVFARDGNAYVVVGTNFGNERQPAWTSNLLAKPEADVQDGDRLVPVTAVPVTDQGERDRLWQLLDDAYVGFASYRRRLADTRAIRMFRLEPRRDDG